LSGLSDCIVGNVQVISGCRYIAIILYLFIIGTILNILTFPLDFMLSYKTEHRFGLLRQNFTSWLNDYIKRIIISSLFYLIGILFLYLFIDISATLWWLYTALAYFFINLFIAKIFPVIIIPLFYRLTEIKDTSLRNKLLSLAENAGVKILAIYNIALGEKTKKANAAVCGLGSTKRMLLSDTLLKEYSEDEVELTLAHELAHHKFHHFWELSIWNFLFTILGFCILNILIKKMAALGQVYPVSDIRSFPTLVIFFIIYNIGTTPFLNMISREYEAHADKEAVRLTKRPVSFVNLITKLSRQNISDPSPGFLTKVFFYDHPPLEERIQPYEDSR
jgi:STE24 endopeptidase